MKKTSSKTKLLIGVALVVVLIAVLWKYNPGNELKGDITAGSGNILTSPLCAPSNFKDVGSSYNHTLNQRLPGADITQVSSGSFTGAGSISNDFVYNKGRLFNCFVVQPGASTTTVRFQLPQGFYLLKSVISSGAVTVVDNYTLELAGNYIPVEKVIYEVTPAITNGTTTKYLNIKYVRGAASPL